MAQASRLRVGGASRPEFGTGRETRPEPAGETPALRGGQRWSKRAIAGGKSSAGGWKRAFCPFLGGLGPGVNHLRRRLSDLCHGGNHLRRRLSGLCHGGNHLRHRLSDLGRGENHLCRRLNDLCHGENHLCRHLSGLGRGINEFPAGPSNFRKTGICVSEVRKPISQPIESVGESVSGSIQGGIRKFGTIGRKGRGLTFFFAERGGIPSPWFGPCAF